MGHCDQLSWDLAAYGGERCSRGQAVPWSRGVRQTGTTSVRLGTRRMRRIQRAGRLTKPNGRLTLTLAANPDVQIELLHYLKAAA